MGGVYYPVRRCISSATDTPPRLRRPACWRPSRTAGRARSAWRGPRRRRRGLAHEQPRVAQLAPGALGADAHDEPRHLDRRACGRASPRPGRSSSRARAQKSSVGMMPVSSPPLSRARRRRRRGRAPRRRRRSRRASGRRPRAPSAAPAPGSAVGGLVRLGHARPSRGARRPRARRRAAARRAPGRRADAHQRVGERRGRRRAPAARSRRRPGTREDVEVRHDRGQPGGQRLEDGEAEALLRRGQGEDVGGAVEALELASLTGPSTRRSPSRPSSPRGRGSGRSRRGSRTASRRRRRAARGGGRAARARGGGEALEQRQRALARLDPADREDRERAVRPAASRAAARSAASRAGGSGRGRRRCRRARPRRRTRRGAARSTAARRTDAVGLGDRADLAGDERRGAEVVDVVDGADHGVDHALVAQRERGVGRDAVLGVDDVEAAVAQQRRAGPRGRRRSARGCARRRRARAATCRTSRTGTGGRGRRGARSASAKARPRGHGRQRLGQRQRVLHPAPGLDRVGEHRDPHPTRRGEPRRGGVGGREARRRRPGRPPGGSRPEGRRRSRTAHDHPLRRAAGPRIGDQHARGVGVLAWPRRCRAAAADAAVAAGARASRGGRRGRSSGAGGPACTPPRRGRGRRARRRRRRPVAADPEHGLEDRHGLVRERAAGEQAQQPPAGAPGVDRASSRRRRADRSPRRRAPASSVAWTSNGASPPSHPTNAATTRLPAVSTSPSRATTSRAGGLETSSNVSVAGVRGQPGDGVEEH